MTKHSTFLGVTVPWAPDFIQQGKEGLEKVHVEFAMPVVAWATLGRLGFSVVLGGN